MLRKGYWRAIAGLTIRYASFRNSSIFWRVREGLAVGRASWLFRRPFRIGVRSVIIFDCRSSVGVLLQGQLRMQEMNGGGAGGSIRLQKAFADEQDKKAQRSCWQ